MRRHWHWLAASIIFVVGTAIAVIAVVGPATTENFSSAGAAGRVVIPGSANVHLEADQQYSLWYGVYVTGQVWNGTPAMTIKIDPPGNAPQPGFSWNDGGGQTLRDNPQALTLELVAYVHPTVAGTYNLQVTSQDGGAGVILVGKTLPPAAPGWVPGLCVFGATVVIAGGVFLIGNRRRSSAAEVPTGASSSSPIDTVT
jgi:hypothetical protein